MKYIFLPIISIAIPTIAIAASQTISINGDYGCTSKEVQTMRIELLQRSVMAENEQIKKQLIEQIVSISNKQCQQLTGSYKVTSQNSAMVEVNADGKKLWILK